MKTKIQYITFLAAIFLTLNGFSQLSEEKIEQIDSLFTPWNAANHPGGTVLISKKGEILFSRAYGLASLEYNIPNTLNTRFNIGSLSKQFTAMGIVLLEEQNKLSFDDDIRKYIPELAPYDTTITIRHLLHHTSGIRDIHGLLGLAGWRAADLETNEDVYRVFKNQKDLNFNPGDELSYSNTGYIFLARIIEKISGLNFDKWMKQNIFDPLGMKNTYVETQHDRIVANNATSYYLRDDFKRAIEYWGYFGSGNMHSKIEDLNIWLQNFSTPQKEWASAFNTLLTRTPLNNGFETAFGFGVRIEEYEGKKVIQHGGSVGGFRAIARVFPGEQLHMVILSNYSKSGVGAKTNIISDILLSKSKVTPEKSTTQKSKTPEFLALPKNRLKKFEGIYWSDSEKSGRKIYLENDTLRYSSSPENSWPLVPTDEHTFIMMHPSIQPVVTFDSNTHQMTIKTGDNLPGVFTFLQKDLDTNRKDLHLFVGHYYSPELKTTYSIFKEGDAMYIEHARHGKMKLKQLYNTIFSTEEPIGILEIKKDKNHKVLGLTMSNGRTRNVWFKRANF
ncbi:serine hydrolase domain-containing protein [Flagellimonas marinaquae]